MNNGVSTMHNNDTQDLSGLFSGVNAKFLEHTSNVLDLMRYTSTPIESEEEVLERAEVMDQIMDMAQHENDVVFLFSDAIAKRIEDFECSMEISRIPTPEILRGLMQIRKVTQRDLKSVASPKIIREILNGKREITVKQSDALAEYFDLPATNFIE